MGKESLFAASWSHDQAMPIYGKNPLKIFSSLVCSIEDMGPITFEKIITFG